MDYKGYREIHLTDEELSNFYASHTLPFYKCLENEYVIFTDEWGEAVDYYIYKNGKLEKLDYPSIGNNFTGQMKPRNSQQYCALDMLKRDDIPIKLLTGRFGSGKSMACIVAALEAVQKGKFERIIFVRNNVQVRDTENIGALPGTADDKMSPYLAPFADHCGGMDGVKMLVNEGKLEVIPLAFLRGRSIKNSILYSMESENLTKEHIQLIMGRIDEGSQLWMDGDFKQRDKVSFEKSQGLECMIERLQGHPLFGYVHMPKTERSEVASLADKLD